MLSSSSNQAIFFLESFYLKNHPKNTYLHSHFCKERILHHCWSSCFHDYVLHSHSLKAFLYWQNLKILISLKRHSFKVKHYIHKTYYVKCSFWFKFQWRNCSAQKKKTILTSLLENLILQNCLHRLNIWGWAYYTTTD